MDGKIKAAMLLLAVLSMLLVIAPSQYDTPVDAAEEGDPWNYPNPVVPYDKENSVTADFNVSKKQMVNVGWLDKDRDGLSDDGRYYALKFSGVTGNETVNMDKIIGMPMPNGTPFPGITDLGSGYEQIVAYDTRVDHIPGTLKSTTLTTIQRVALNDTMYGTPKNSMDIVFPNLKNIGTSVFEYSNGDIFEFGDFSNVEYVGKLSFYAATLESSWFPNLKSIDMQAFEGAHFRDSINFPCVERINICAFKNCKTSGGIDLPSLTFTDFISYNMTPDGDGNAPFDGAKADYIKLKSYPAFDDIVINMNVPRVELDSATYRTNQPFCTHIGTLYLPSIKEEELYMPGAHTDFGDYQYYNVSVLEVPNITWIDSNAFEYNHNLDKVIAPKLESVNSFAFHSCSISVLETDCLDHVSVGAFQNSKLKLPGYTADSQPSYIGPGAYLDSNLTEAWFNQVDDLGQYAFAGNKLKTADFTGMTEVEDGLLMGCPLEEVMGYGMSTVNKDMFTGNKLTSFDFSRIEYVGDNAFKGLQMSSIDAPLLKHIGDSAFAESLVTAIDAPLLNHIGDSAFGGNVITQASMGKLEYVGSGIFKNSGFVEGTLDLSGLVHAGDYSFYGNSFTHIGRSIQTIGSHAFEGNPIASIDVPGLTDVGDFAFHQVPLETMNAPELYKVGEQAFVGTQLTELMCPNLEYVGYAAFRGVPIAENDLSDLYDIGAEAFKDTNLTGKLDVYLCAFGESAFENTKITDFEETGVNYIPVKAFKNVTTLERVMSKCSFVWEQAFEGCTSLSAVDMPNLEQVWDRGFADTGPIKMKFLNANYIGIQAFENSGIKDVVTNPLPGLEISDGAFQHSSLDHISISAYTTTGSNVFAYSSLRQIIIDKAELGKDAFLGCEKLQMMNVRNYVYLDPETTKVYEQDGDRFDLEKKKLYSSDFVYFPEECIFLDSDFRVEAYDYVVGFPGDSVDYRDIDLPYHECLGFVNTMEGEVNPKDHRTIPLYYDEKQVFNQYFFPYFDYFLPYHLFKDGLWLTSIPDGMDLSETIPSYGYKGIEKLPVRKIDDLAFTYRDSLNSICLDNVWEIGKYAFAGSGLNGTVEFKNLGDVKSIGTGAFDGCYGITEFVGSDGEGRYSVCNKTLYENDVWGPHSILHYFPASSDIINFHAPIDCVYIADNAFRNATNLDHVHLNNGLREIGSHAFDGLTEILEYVIPSTVNSIELSSFGDTVFMMGDRELTVSELPGHRYLGNVDTMYVVDEDAYYPIVLELNGKEVEQPYPVYAEKDKNGGLLLPPDPVCRGYKFVGWNENRDGSGEFYVSGDQAYAVDRLFAIWEVEVYNIVYDNLMGADNKGNPETYTIEDDFVINIPTREDATFFGWIWEGHPWLQGYIYFEPGVYTGDQHLTATWMEIYTITYLGMEGVEDPGNPTEYQADDTFTLENPEKEGYEFLGWTGNGHISPTRTMTVYPKTTGDLEFTAHWRVIYYWINYTGLDWADNSMNPIEYTVEDEIIIQNPLAEGYEFLGWYIPGHYGYHIEPKIEKGTTGDLQFDAKWALIEYSITYNGTEGADNSRNPDKYTVRDTVELSDPTKDGYRFVGWTGEGMTEPSHDVSIPLGSIGDRTYTANWVDDTFTILYAGVWNAENDNPKQYKEGDSFVLKDARHDGFEFRGWTGNGVTEPTKGLKVEAGTTGDLLFVAHWTADSYSITYDGLEGADNSANPTTYTIKDTFVLKNPSRDNYMFLGWTGNGIVEPTTSMEVKRGTTGDLNFTANWKATPYNITYTGLMGADNSANPRTYTVEDAFALKDLELKGYEFLGWTGNGVTEPTRGLNVQKGTTGNLEFVAHWNTIEYTITYIGTEKADSNDNPVSYCIEDEFTLKDPERGGFEFLGWTVRDTDEPAKDLKVTKGTTGDLTFTAHWEANTYTITYIGIEDADNKGNPTAYTAGDSIKLRDPTREQYEFLGWTGNGATEPVKDMTISETTYGDLTLTANWDYIEVRIETDLGDTVTEASFDGEITRNADGTVNIPATEPVADGYEFIGWYTSAEGGETVNDGDVFEGGKLYAGWGVVIYDITYKVVEGAVNPNPTEYTVEDSFTLSIVTKDGYEFLGWTGNGATEPTMQMKVEQGTTGDLEFTAEMEMIEYVIVYSWVLGAENDNPVRYTVEDAFTLNDAAKDGYEFLGWTGNGINEPTKGLKVDAGTTGFLKFRANWSLVDYSITYNDVEDAVNDNPSTYTVRDLPLVLNQPVREGYNFLGWDDGGKVSAEMTVPAGTTGDLTFTAKWEQIVHTVTLDTVKGNLALNGSDVTTPYKAEYAAGTPISVDGAKLTVGDDVYIASHPYHDTVRWSVQANAQTVDRDLKALALFSDSVDPVTGMSIKTNPEKTSYVLGERFDPTGMTLEVIHESGKTEVVESGYTCNPTVFFDLDTDHVEVTYDGFTDECPVKVSDGIKGIFISKEPDKTEYAYGEWFDPTGMEVSVKYLSGKTMLTEDYTYSPEILDEIGTMDIEIRYEGFTAYQEVTVTPGSEPLPDETDRFVFVHVDEAGIISDDAALAAAHEIRIATGYNPGKVIIVEVRSPVHESITIPEVLADAVREYDSRMIVSTTYGSIVLTADILSTDGVRGDLDITVHKVTEGDGFPEGFIDRGAVFDLELKADGKVCSRFDAPIEVRIFYPTGSDVPSSMIRVYHSDSGLVIPIDDAQERLDRFVSFRTDHFSEFAVKIAGDEYSVSADVEGDGTVRVSSDMAEQHVTVFVDATAGEGQAVKSLTVDGKALEEKDGRYFFEMPAYDVVVKAVFGPSDDPAPVPDPEGGDGGDSLPVVIAVGVVVLLLVAIAAVVMIRKR